MDNQTVGVVGLGRIGLPIAINLARAGFPVRATDTAPRPDRVEELTAAGGHFVESAAMAAESSDVLITLLPDSSAVAAVLLDDAVLEALSANSVCVDMTSGYPADTRRIAAGLMHRRGISLVDAPICNGGVPGAYEGTLVLCLGGDKAILDGIRPVLEAVAGTLVHVGAVGDAQTIKLLSNYVALGVAAMAAEIFGIAAASGLEPRSAADALSHCVARKFINLEHLTQVLLEEDHPQQEVNFRVDLARKDLRYVAAHAAEHGVWAPMAEGGHAHFLVAEGAGLALTEAIRGPWALTLDLLGRTDAAALTGVGGRS